MVRMIAPFKKLTTWLLVGLLAVATFGLTPVWARSANSMSVEDRTVALTATEDITFSTAELDRGRQLFSRACGQCHIAGSTYPNPDVELNLEDLANATPPRNTVMSIVDYLKDPTSYDGMDSLLEIHPNVQLTSEFPKMRNLSDDDLKVIAGHILNQAKVLPGWGLSKNLAHDPTWGRIGVPLE